MVLKNFKWTKFHIWIMSIRMNRSSGFILGILFIISLIENTYGRQNNGVDMESMVMAWQYDVSYKTEIPNRTLIGIPWMIVCVWVLKMNCLSLNIKHKASNSLPFFGILCEKLL